MTLLSCKKLSKTYFEGKHALTILNGIDFSIEKNQTIAIVGASGSGKSTFLHLLAGLDFPSSGEVCFQGRNWAQLTETQRANLRLGHLGFIYQFHHLLMDFSAVENVSISLLLQGVSIAESQERAKESLAHVGLSDRLHHRVSELSGGERQRVAIARAVVTRPSCILADEPTGNLDEENAQRVLDVFFALQHQYSTSLILVTHDSKIASRAQTVLTIHQGKIG